MIIDRLSFQWALCFEYNSVEVATTNQPDTSATTDTNDADAAMDVLASNVQQEALTTNIDTTTLCAHFAYYVNRYLYISVFLNVSISLMYLYISLYPYRKTFRG